MSDVSEVKYAELHTRYREASMLADKYELIAKTHQDVNESLRETNDDLRRMLIEKDEENAKLRELIRLMDRRLTPISPCKSIPCGECPVKDECDQEDALMRELGIEVDG